MSGNTVSALSILEALRGIEKNPFSATQSLSLTGGNAYQVADRKETTTKPKALAAKRKGINTLNTTSSSRDRDRDISLEDSLSDIRVAKYVQLPTIESVESPDINEANMPLLEKDDFADTKMTTLKSDRKRELNNISKIEKKTAAHLDDAVSMIPAHYFVSHKMFDQIKSKALDSVWSILVKMRRRLLRQGISMWHERAMVLTAILKEESAATICRVVRGFLGRRKALAIHKRRLADMKSKSRTDAIALMNRGERALLIQTAFRRWIVYAPFQIFIRKHRAAVCIQRAYSSYRNEGRLYDAVVEVMGQISSSRVIQRNFRGLLGRMKARIRRSELHRAKIAARYETPEGVFEFYFEQNGAALRIQRWYRSLWWVVRIKGDERRLKRKKMIDGRARLIQRIVRGFIGRRKAAKQKEIRKLHAWVNLKLVIMVQAVARRFLTYKRNRNIIALLKSKRLKRQEAKAKNIGTRRNAISFEHLKIGDERNIIRMDRKAKLIQKTYKSFRMLRYFSNMIKFRRVMLVIRIQRWFRTWCWRRRIYAALKIIQPVWKFKMYKYLKRKYAANKIRNRYRTYRSMKWFHDWKRKIRNNANKLQRWGVYRSYIRRRRVALNRDRLNEESRLAGEKLYARTELFAQIDELYKRLVMTKIPLAKHEPQALFMSYCPQSLLDMGKAFKMVKECPGLLEPPQLTMKTVEMIFAKVKGTSGRGLEYFQMIEFLFHLACMKYHGIDASLLHNTTAGADIKPTSAKDSKSSTKAKKFDQIAQYNATVAAERFGRYSGKDALVARISFEFLRQNDVFKKAEADLDAKSAASTAQRRVDTALYTLQRMFRLLIFLHGLYRVRMMANTRKREMLVSRSAILIQAIMRGYLGRRAVVRLAQVVYMKFIDVDSQADFWSNTHLGTSHWVKPSLLRELDCGDGIKMPTSDEQYSPLCTDCNTAAATCFCDQCDKLFCESCFSGFHKSGVRRSHDKITLEMCIDCTFQVPTKQCIPCDDVYCDTCFRFAHRRGRARLHTFRWVAEHCDLCDERAAHWRRIDTFNRYAEEHLCTICFKRDYGDPEVADYTGQIQVYRVKYYGPTVLKYRKDKADAEAKRKAAEEYARLVEESLRKRRDRGVTTIQRVYRGYRVRREVAPFLEQRRVFLLFREKEMPKRKAWLYQARDVFGLAPSLKSDTNKEKVLRVFPKYLRPTVKECVERKWGVYCELLKPPDLGPDGLTPDKLSFGAGVMALGGLMSAKFMLMMQERAVNSNTRKHLQARERYRAARSSATVKPERKKQLQTHAHDFLKKMESSKTKRDEELDNVTLARKKWEHFAGPRGLQNTVAQRRKEGVPMPFTLQMAAGSRYALVKYGVPSKDATKGHETFPTKPGSWRKLLHVGDVLMLHGMHFRVVEGEDMLDILEEFEGDGDSDSTSDDDDDEDEESLTRKGGVVNSSRAAVGKKAPPNKGREGNEGEAKVDGDNVDGDVDGRSLLGDDSVEGLDSIVSAPVIAKQYTMLPLLRSASSMAEGIGYKHDIGIRGEDHIKLDRIWLFEDVPYLSAYRVAVKPIHTNCTHKVTRAVHESWSAQKIVLLMALLFDKLSKTVSASSKLFDEESETGAKMIERGKAIGEYRDWFMKASRKSINFDYEFAVKKLLVKVLKACYNIPKKAALNAFENYKRQRAFAKLSPYRRWEMSQDKVEIVVYLESGLENRMRLGTIMMDLDAPCDVMRSYIERNFRDELNEECGHAFSMFVRDDKGFEQLLNKDEEELKWAKDFAPMAPDEKSDGAMLPTVTLVKNEGEDIDIINENFSDGGFGEFEEDEGSEEDGFMDAD